MKKTSTLGLTLALSTVALAEASPVIVQWQRDHAVAAQSLAGWIQANREAARPIFHWARAHPLRAQAFIKWFVDHPKQGFDDFLTGHSDWPAIDLVLKPNRPAMEALARWASEHPAGANALAAVPRGLSVAGMQLYRELWDEQTARDEHQP